MDYKEILGKKIERLQILFNRNGENLPEEKRNLIIITINNALLSIDGRLDAFDYDVRDKAIMDWHDKLDSLINSLDIKSNDKDEIEK